MVERKGKGKWTWCGKRIIAQVRKKEPDGDNTGKKYHLFLQPLEKAKRVKGDELAFLATFRFRVTDDKCAKTSGIVAG